MIEKTKQLVFDLMKDEDTGHGMEHINRVLDLSLDIAKTERCDKELVSIIALLHDVDDYKIFGLENQQNLTNTNLILNKLGLDESKKQLVLEQVANIGYSKRLKGKEPTAIEGKIVSDADMCDGLGVAGIIRTHKYELKHGKPFFDKNIWPMEDVNGKTYGKKCSDTAVCHMFEKILRLKNLMLTKSGKNLANERTDFIINFLFQLFKEERAPKWEQYLKEFIAKN